MAIPDEDGNQAAGEPQNRIVAYINEADNACKAGDSALGVHLYLAAFGFATHVSNVPNEDAIIGLKRAWSVACAMKERALAEYIFEKMEPYLTSVEASHCANQLQSLALEKLAEFGLSQEVIAKMTGLNPGVDVDPGSLKLVHLSTIHHPLDEHEDGFKSPSHAALADREDEDVNDALELDESLLKELDEVFTSRNEPAASFPDRDLSIDMIDTLSGNSGLQFPPVEGLDNLSLEEKFSNALINELDNIDAAVSEESAPDTIEGNLPDFVNADTKVEATLDVPGDADPAPAKDRQIDDDSTSDLEWDPNAAPTLDDKGLSLGPGFGLRAAPQTEDPDGAAFEDMLKSLGILMEGFDSKTGERITNQEAQQTAGSISNTREVKLITYADLVGYSNAIQTMQSFGIGMRDDPDYLVLVEALNQLHGMEKMPATDTMLFRALAREDASHFMEATANELDLPLLKMGMDENLQGAFMLCLTVRADKPPQMNRQRTSFDGPAILCLEDVDLWMSPTEYMDEEGASWQQHLTRGARDTIQLIRNAVLSPDVYVMATMSSYGEIDPFFCDLLTPFSVIDIDVPDEFERADIWRDLMREHPSLADLRLSDLVKFSANMPRSDIYTAVREALEEAYKQSLAMRTYLPVTYDNLLEKLSAYQPIDSEEYQGLEEEVARSLRGELEAYGSVDALLGLEEPKGEDDDGPLFDPSVKIDSDNPFFSL